MRTYYVIRHGSNAGNQTMTPEMVIGSVEASNRTIAKKRADKEFGDECYHNQFLSVKAEGRYSAEELRSIQESLAFTEGF